MTAKNKISIITLLFFLGLMAIDYYRVTVIIKLHEKPIPVILQFGRSGSESASLYNSFAEYPEDDMSVDLYSEFSGGKSIIPNDPDSADGFFKIHFKNTNLISNIDLNHLNICYLDLPPPFCSI